MTAMNINKEKAIKLINLLIIQKDSFTKIKKIAASPHQRRVAAYIPDCLRPSSREPIAIQMEGTPLVRALLRRFENVIYKQQSRRNRLT